MPKADAKQRNPPGEGTDRFQRNPRLIGRARPRRHDDLLGRKILDLLQAYRIVAVYLDIHTQLAQILNDVVGKRVVIVDH